MFLRTVLAKSILRALHPSRRATQKHFKKQRIFKLKQHFKEYLTWQQKT
jgi:hypothetical protein